MTSCSISVPCLVIRRTDIPTSQRPRESAPRSCYIQPATSIESTSAAR